jgi:hypothetical protein
MGNKFCVLKGQKYVKDRLGGSNKSQQYGK